MSGSEGRGKPPPLPSRKGPRVTTRAVLLTPGGEVRLGTGTSTIGRSVDCEVVLADTGVSRHHARLKVTETGTTIEDAGSSHGTRLNGTVIDAEHPIESGDVIVVGRTPIQFLSVADEGWRRVAATTVNRPAVDLTDSSPVSAPPPTEAPAAGTPIARLRKVVGKFADASLSKTELAMAEALVAHHLDLALKAARAGRIQPAERQWAAGYAIKLAKASGEAKYIDYVIELYSPASVPVAYALIDALEEAMQSAPDYDREALAAYVRATTAVSASLSGAAYESLVRLTLLAES